jgi:hypothetical protein
MRIGGYADAHPPYAFFTCQTAHLPPSLKLRRASLQTRHSRRRRRAFPQRDGAQVVKWYPPRRGVGGAPTGARVQRHPVGYAMTRHARALARRPASHNAGRAPLGAPPWRFVAGGRASVCGISSAARAASSSQPSHSAWRAGPRTSRGAVTSRRRRTPHLAPLSGSSLENAPR